MGNIDQEVRGWSVFVATLRFRLIRICEIKLDANMKSLNSLATGNCSI